MSKDFNILFASEKSSPPLPRGNSIGHFKITKKESIIWKQFNIAPRDPKSHRRKGSCLHCGTKFHDCRMELLQRHALSACKQIPVAARQQCIDEIRFVEELDLKCGKRKKPDYDSNITIERRYICSSPTNRKQ